MKNPLAICQFPEGDWQVFATEKSIRGHRVKTVVFLRDPTPEEAVSLKLCLTPGGQMHVLTDLLEDVGG